jgi:hypothetical protein
MTEHRDRPEWLGSSGARLWDVVTVEYTLEDHESVLLEQVCRAADVCDRLAAVVVAADALTTPEGRVMPELVELRQQQLLLARLLAALRVPLGEETADEGTSPTPRLQRRVGVRGGYGAAS